MSGTPVCVNPDTWLRLADRGWGMWDVNMMMQNPQQTQQIMNSMMNDPEITKLWHDTMTTANPQHMQNMIDQMTTAMKQSPQNSWPMMNFMMSDPELRQQMMNQMMMNPQMMQSMMSHQQFMQQLNNP